ncbi:MAG: hypothetical protein PQJ49_05010 [Sphaerochaetaceae bacterium]|nr:hypothetical protein [Sphaerochaetaceae bacterium]
MKCTFDYVSEINNAFNSFSKEMKFITYYKSSKHTTYKNELEQLKKLGDNAWSSHTIFFKDIIKNTDNKALELLELEFEDIKKYLKVQLNRDYQMLLASAYEFFQKFIDELYAILGFYKPSIWNEKGNSKCIYKKDYSDINDIRNLIKFEDKRKIMTYDQLNDIRTFLPKIKVYEEKDSNYLFMIVLISQLRHNIIHNNGYVDRYKIKEKIYKELKDKLSYSICLDRDEEYTSIINQFFGINEYSNMICLTEIYKTKIRYVDRFQSILLYDLISYANLLKQLTIDNLLIKSE